jgi:lactoylglutathione lyase
LRIEHVAIWVRDLEAMKAFYVKYFGASSNEKYVNTRKQFQSYFLTFGDASRLELMSMPGIHERIGKAGDEFIGIAHLAISVGSHEKVDLLTEELRADGFQVIGEPRTTGDGYYESVILDPEHNRIEITA